MLQFGQCQKVQKKSVPVRAGRPGQGVPEVLHRADDRVLHLQDGGTVIVIMIDNDDDNLIMIMQVSEQFWAYTFLAYIAECGGFVGLFLGYSLLQIEDLVTLCRKKK